MYPPRCGGKATSHQRQVEVPQNGSSSMSFKETHYSVNEVAKLWKYCPDVIRDIFKDRPDVPKVIRPKTRTKREYVSLRIPESVMQRVYLTLTKAA
jgi:hypothetical protein